MQKVNEYGLTQQQENFVQAYFKCGIGRKAYRIAYPSSVNWKDENVDSQASRLLNNSKVNTRLAQLNEAAESTLKQSTTLNKRKLLETALQMLEDTNNPVERTHAVSLIKLLFQKEGMLQPETVTQVNIQNNTVVNEVSDFLNL